MNEMDKAYMEHIAHGGYPLDDDPRLAALAGAGFERGDNPAEEGAETCTGCWDKSDHNINVDTCIPAGEHAWYRQCNVEYDEWDAYCLKCALGYAAQNC